jgi:acetyl esterase/lipase
MVHGGAFAAGSPFQPQVERVCQILANHGFSVFNVCYRLAPCGRIPGQDAHDGSPEGIASGRPPQQTDDVMALVKAARADSRCKNHKVGVLGVSSGGTLATYVSLYRGTISGTGRPDWNVGGQDDRPDCAAVFSGVYDLSDQIPDDEMSDSGFIEAVENYVNSCVPSQQRMVSPISLVNTNTKNSFKSLFLVNSIGDRTVPGRQIFDMQCVLNNAGVNPADFTLLQITDGSYNDAHALNLWPAPDPNTGRTVGADVIAFFHQHLD